MKRPIHRLVLGPYRSLETHFLNAVTAVKKEGDALSPVDILVRSNLLAVYLRRLVASHVGAVANLRFHSFADVARWFVRPSGSPLPALGAVRLARRALEETPDAAVFGPLRERPSLARALIATADDLFDAGIRGQDVRAQLPRSGRTADRRAFLAGVAATVERFEELRGRFEDAALLLDRAARADDGGSAGDGALLSAGPLLVYGFDELGGVREALLRRVARRVSVLAFAPVARGDLAAGSNSPNPLFTKEGASEDDLADAEAAYFEGSDDTPPSFGSALSSPFLRLLEWDDVLELADVTGARRSVVLAPGDDAEAREVVREVLTAVSDGVPLHRIAILLREPARQEAAVLAELRLRDIPCFRPARPDFSREPLGRAARTLLELVVEDFPRGTFLELFDLLEGLGLLPTGGSRPGRAVSRRFRGALKTLGFTRGRVALLDRIARAKSRLVNAAIPLPDDPEGRIAKRRESRGREIESFESAVLAIVAAIGEPVPHADQLETWDAWAVWLRDAFDELFGPHPDAARLASATASISALDAIEPDAKVSLRELAELFPDALDTVVGEGGHFERDGVALLSCTVAQGLLFDVVIVPGLVEDMFPKSPRPDPLLFDAERRRVARASGRPLPSRAGERHTRAERLLFDLAVASAPRVVLVASRRDTATDRERLPSPFLFGADRDTEPRLPNHTTEPQEPRDGADSASVRAVSQGRVCRDGPALDEEEAAHRRVDRNPAELAHVVETMEPLERALRRGRARWSDVFTEFEGSLGRPTERFDPASRVLSPSGLERFAACAYRTFFRSVLGLVPPDDEAPALTPDGLALGAMAHGALAGLARELIAEGKRFSDLPKPELHKRVARLTNDQIEAWAERGEPDLPPIFLELAKERLSAILTAVVRHEAERPPVLRPAGVEVRFGPTEIDPMDRDEDPALSFDEPVTVETPSGRVSFTGKIDRLDRDGTEGATAHVVDYKVGKASPYEKSKGEPRLVAGGERIQLPIYALAARRLGAERVTSEYVFAVRDETAGDYRIVPARFDEAETAESVELLSSMLVAVQGCAERGLLIPKTESARYDEPCRFCDFATICGPGHETIYNRKWVGEKRRSKDGGATRWFLEMQGLR